MNCFRKDCESKSTDYKVCAQCFRHFYCSEECLESDWFARHEAECEGHQFKLTDFSSCSSILGSGAYSEVKLFKHKATSQLYAVKIIKKSILSVLLPLHALFREISLHKSMNHENIISLYDQLEDDKKIYLVLEYAGSSTLLDFLKHKKVLTEPQAARILVELCLALKHMHDMGVMHRDLKPDNVLMTSSGQVKVCDLGWSVFCEAPRKTYCGTLDYMAPEVFEGLEYSFSADVWSLGVMLVEMVQGANPFIFLTESEKAERIRRKSYETDEHISKPCQDQKGPGVPSGPAVQPERYPKTQMDPRELLFPHRHRGRLPDRPQRLRLRRGFLHQRHDVLGGLPGVFPRLRDP